jgi:methylated-DNA-[protein]-cysteine S-methyltransferase
MSQLERPPTAFQERVYDAVRMVPHGRVTTYKLLGLAIGCGSSRAVGQALRRNPYMPEVPCHRVVSSDRRIGGFAGESGGAEVDRKRAMLEAEGIEFGEDGRVAESVVFEF